MRKNNYFKYNITVSILLFLLCNFNMAKAYDSSAVNYYNQGTSQAKLGDYTEAIKLFKKSIEIDPSLTDVYYNLGIAYESIDDANNAIKSFEVWVRSHPSDDETIYHIAKLYYETRNYQKALFYVNTIPPGSSKFNEAQVLLNSVTKKLNSQKQDLASQVGQQTATYMNFDGPTGIDTDSRGNLYVAQYSSNSIVKITPDNNRKIFIKGKPLGGPIGLTVDSRDNLYVANYLSNTVIKITPSGEILTVLKDVKQPYNVSISNSSGYLYVTCQGDKSVIKLKL